MDYSLVVGMDVEKKELVVGIIGAFSALFTLLISDQSI